MTCHFKIGKAIKRAQAIADVDNEKLAAAMSVTPTQVSRWRQWEDAKVSRVVQLSAYFSMSVDEFLELGR